MLKITITNRSAWPDWFIQPLASWVARRAGIDWPYRLTLKSAVRPSYWRGVSYGRHESNLTYHRRGTGSKSRDHRFSWGPAYQIRPGIEALVYLMAHEMCHATTGHPARWPGSGGRVNRDAMEHHCNEFGVKAAAAFREEWPAFRAAMLRRLRSERDRKRTTEQRRARREAESNTHAAKVAEATARLTEWQRKEARCHTWIAKYKRKLRALHAAETRRVRASESLTPGATP